MATRSRLAPSCNRRRRPARCRGTPDSVDVTDGPFAETAEQLGGFYLVETDDIDHVIKLAGLISYGEPIEVRPTTSGEAGAS